MKTLLSILFFTSALWITAEIVDRIYDGTGPPTILFLVLGPLIIVGAVQHYFLGGD